MTDNMVGFGYFSRLGLESVEGIMGNIAWWCVAYCMVWLTSWGAKG
jgi:hypothetical protein